jgi:hypothetical protein
MQLNRALWRVHSALSGIVSALERSEAERSMLLEIGLYLVPVPSSILEKVPECAQVVPQGCLFDHHDTQNDDLHLQPRTTVTTCDTL